MRKIPLFVLALVSILTAFGVVAFLLFGGTGDRPDDSARVHPVPTAVTVLEPHFTRQQVREALPVSTDVGPGWRRYRRGVERDNPRSVLSEAGVPLCHRSGLEIGTKEEWMMSRHRSRTPDGTNDGYYVATAVYADAAAAVKALGTIRDAVAACPRRYEQRREAMRIGYVPGSVQTWTPEPVETVNGWRRVRATQLMQFGADARRWNWQDTTVRTVNDYYQRGNAIIVQQFWIWGIPGGDAVVRAIKNRADALMRITARLLAASVAAGGELPVPDPSTGAPCDRDGMECEA